MTTALPPVIIQEEPDDPSAVGLSNTPAPEGDAISLPTPTQSTQPPTPDIAQQRTAKTVSGGIVDKSPDQIYQEYLLGQEAMVRKEVASRADFMKHMQREQQIQDAASRKGAPLDPAEVLHIVDPFNPANAPTDPDTVLERAYATNYMSSLNVAKGFMNDSILDRAKVEMPQVVQAAQDDASELLTKNQYILTRMQNTEQNLVQQQSWPGYLADQAKTMFQPYVEYKERGLIEGSSKLAGIGLGSNLDEQHYQLYSMPLDQFKTRFDAAMQYLEKDNPALAVAYAKSLLSQSTMDATIGNTFSAMAIPDYLAIGKVGAKVASKITRANQVRRAAADMVTSAVRDPEAGPIRAAEGAGDTSEAAVQKVSKIMSDALSGKGDPVETAKDAFMSTWLDDQKKAMSNTGTYLSRELQTRILNGITRDAEDLYNRAVTMHRVERTPEAVTNPDVIRAYKDQIKVDYTGPQSTVLDVDGPIREPLSGTYWYKTRIGNYDATQFPDLETARGFANQLGISEPIIKGVESDRVYLSPVAAKNIESIKTTPTGTRFFTDHDVEVLPSSRPEPGHVPYNIKTNKFEPALTEESARIEQQGLGFHIEVWTPMKEDSNLIRDLMIKTTSGEPVKDAISTSMSTPVNRLKNAALGWLRNSDETMSVNESAQRKAATYARSNLDKWMAGLSKELEDVAAGRVREDPVTGERLSPLTVYPKTWVGKITNRQVARDFERTLDAARKMEDPETGKPGYFMKTFGELQDFYNRNFQRDPSYLETKAYFNYVKLYEGDRMLMEVSEFRNRARVGTEQHAISFTDPNTGQKIQSPFFDGIKHNKLPGNQDQDILIVRTNRGEETLHTIANIDDKTKKAMNERIKTGEAKLIEVFDKSHQPLSNFSEITKDQIIHYVYATSAESKPIQFNHVERRGGGHFEWDYDNYLKIADVRPQFSTGINDKRKGFTNRYVGDITVMPIKNAALGRNVAKIWNEAHELIKANRWDEVKPLVAKLGIKYDEFTSWYHPGRDTDGNPTRPRLNPHEPVQVVSRGKTINQMDASLQSRYTYKQPDGSYRNTFVDDTVSGPANNFKVAYNQERNSSSELKTVNDVGTARNPIYAHQPADMVDPLTTMNRSLNRAINSTFMDDYKLYTVEHWLREAEPYLKADSVNEIRSSPFAWFQKPEWRAGVDKTIIWNLEANRYKAQQFIGIPNKFDTWIHSVTTQMADNAYIKYGPEEGRSLLGKAATIVPINMLHRITDPVSWMRSITFNFKLGLFSPAQFLVQAQTHSLIWALEPRHGTVGTYHMMLHNWSKFTDNPRILEALDNYATKLNMFGSKTRPGEFLEARRELAKTGFENVAGEYANLNNQLKTRFIKNDFDKGLHIGQYPFRLGEGTTRQTAWYTAFREFRDANPTTPITNIERSKILNKADLLTVNMSRASSSIINSGVFSLSTQFLTYQIKLGELFWGKRIGETATERNLARFRMVGFFAALYGIPNAVGVTGAPVSDNIRQGLLDDLGYIPGEHWYSSLVNEGLPAWMLAVSTGELPNVGDRYGSQGFQNLKQALRGDIPWWQTVGGASTSVMSNFLGAMWDPFYQGATSWARGDTGDSRFTLRAADLVEPLKEISTYSQAAKWLAAINTGKWISKNEAYVTDVSPLYATMLGLTGMNPQSQDDMFITNKMITGEEDMKKKVAKEFIKDWRRGIESKTNNDPEQGNAYIRNAMARAKTAGFSPEDTLKWIAISNKGYEKAIDSSDWNDWNKGDYNKRQPRLEQYKRKLHMEDK